MKKKWSGKQTLLAILSLFLVFSVLPFTGGIIQATSDPVYVIAASDYQNTNGGLFASGASTEAYAIMSRIKQDHENAYGFLFGGDYYAHSTNTTTESANGKKQLKDEIVDKIYPNMEDANQVYIQGNHDNDALTNNGTLSTSGAHDTDRYGVFVINEKDYMWYNDNSTTIKNTATALKAYLTLKAKQGYSKPIFVLSHLPLHYTNRTKNEGDGKYAKYLYDVLDEAGENGLNIVFLYGHNHSTAYDSYLGNGSVYLAEGDSIAIAEEGSQTSYFEDELTFTYMNYGFVGYVGMSNADSTLTMTVFEIYDNQVVVKRYDKNDVHNLKSLGGSTQLPSGLSVNQTVYASGQTISLSTPINYGPAATTTLEVEDNSGAVTGERTYSRVDNINELKSNEQYLFFFDDGNKIMTPEEYSYNSRTGMKYAASPVTVGAETITGEFGEYEFKLQSNNSGWLIGNGTQNIAYTAYSTSLSNENKYAITYEHTGTTFTIGGSSGSYNIYAIYGNTNIYFDENSRGMVSGYQYASGTVANFYIYKLESNTSNVVQTSGGNWITITEPSGGTTKHKYTLDTDGTIESGKKYLIVSSNANSGNALKNNSGSAESTEVKISNNTTIEVTDDSNIAWIFSKDNGGNGSNNGYNIYLGSGKVLSTNFRNLVVKNLKNGKYTIQRAYSSYYLRHNNGSWSRIQNLESELYLYKYDSSSTIGGTNGLYKKIEGELAYTVENGTTYEEALQIVKAGITVKSATNSSYTDEDVYGDDAEYMDWALDSSYGNGTTPGEYAVTIKYDDETLGVAKVIVPAVSKKKLNVSIDTLSATVRQGVTDSKKTGSTLTITDENGNIIETVPVTIGMLRDANGNPISTETEGTISNLDIYYTYNGKEYKLPFAESEKYTLTITQFVQNNYPDYPNEGAVKVNKTAKGIDFQSSGVAQVELSVSGVPSKKGVDVIVMLDTSSSMKRGADTDNEVAAPNRRIDFLQTAVANLIREFQTTGEDGEPLDVKVAISEFNGYTHINTNQTLTGTSVQGASNTAEIFTGSGKADAEAFVPATSIKNPDTFAANIGPHSGTNYDYAFDTIYRLGTAIKEENENNYEDRDLFVIFMSDGAPYQYNYYGSQTVDEWNDYLLGTINTNLLGGNYKSFYNADGKHWMAEAVKGDPNQDYLVIDPTKTLGVDANVSNDGDYFRSIKGLGAELHTIGFCFYDDDPGSDKVDVVYESTQREVMKQLASVDGYGNAHYHETKSGADLNDIFCKIASHIAYAATNAYFLDQMGDDFDLKISTSDYLPEGVVDVNQKKTIVPTIEVKSYDIYTRQDYYDKKCTIDQIGDRKGTFSILETIRFNNDGTKAYSSLIDVNNNGVYGFTIKDDGTVVFDEEDNILGTDGIIYAKNFAYNTNHESVTINGITIESESFYWYVGTVTTTELAISYYVYLTGSMQGLRDAGSYDTNNYATLYYKNYLGNDCLKQTISPALPWESALVRYAFYLVNTEGKPVNNNGEVVTFANKVPVTQPVVYDEIYLNNSENVQSLEVASSGTLPSGYTLYDSSAVYTVKISSNATGEWSIVKGNTTASTYVTDFSDTLQYSNALTETSPSYDYTATTVWFAVVWNPKCLNDTVVVDYGLPVDIHVLGNDMFGDYGRLVGIANGEISGNSMGDATNKVTSTNVTGSFGTAKVTTTDENGVALDKDDCVVTYTPTTMSMNGKETFTYSVNYNGAANKGYYYGTLNIIPATTIYYEDNFLTYNSYDNKGNPITDEQSTYLWKNVVDETAVNNAKQDEDRPGEYSLPNVDANNVYGHDNVNNYCSTYSLGAAKKVHVDNNSYATAEFDFYGTGFDVVALTSNKTGMLAVDVYPYENGKVADNSIISNIVDTYYGYTYDNTTGKWVLTNNSGDNVLYQVPVLKYDNLSYGRYHVKLTATYGKFFDHTGTENTDGTKDGYDLYIDAIRIYDPANDGATDTTGTILNAYKADKEAYPMYYEVRNMLINDVIDKFGNASLDDTTTISGAVFIDGNKKDAEMGDYVSYGPNNEVYLNKGQAISFNLTPNAFTSNPVSVQIGLKSANGSKVSYKIFNADSVAAKEKALEINTSTDMYYDITALRNKTIVVYNTSDSILSITNIKFTFDVKSEETTRELPVMMTYRSAMRALKSINYVPFNPSVFEGMVEMPKVTVGESATYTVTTSSDVEYLMVEDKQITEYKEDANGNRIWDITIETSEVGEKSVEVYAYNKDGEACENTITATVKAEEKVVEPSIKVEGDDVIVSTGNNVSSVIINGNTINDYTEEGSNRIWKDTLEEDETDIKVEIFDEDGNKIDEITESTNGMNPLFIGGGLLAVVLLLILLMRGGKKKNEA